MKKAMFMLALASMMLTATGCFSQTETSSKVKWMSVPQALEQASKDGDSAKMFFIDCYTDWCGYCRLLDSKTFSNDTVAAILNYYYYPCKFDAEGRQPVKINGNIYNPSTRQGRGGTHELMKLLWEGQSGSGYPTMAIRKSDFRAADCLLGFRNAQELEPVLVYFAEGYNKEMSLKKFSDKYSKKYRGEVLKKVFEK